MNLRAQALSALYSSVYPSVSKSRLHSRDRELSNGTMVDCTRVSWDTGNRNQITRHQHTLLGLVFHKCSCFLRPLSLLLCALWGLSWAVTQSQFGYPVWRDQYPTVLMTTFWGEKASLGQIPPSLELRDPLVFAFWVIGGKHSPPHPDEGAASEISFRELGMAVIPAQGRLNRRITSSRPAWATQWDLASNDWMLRVHGLTTLKPLGL